MRLSFARANGVPMDKWVCWQAAWPTILDIWSAGNLPRRANPIKYHLRMSQREHIAGTLFHT
jgi:hypothetical protein